MNQFPNRDYYQQLTGIHLLKKLFIWNIGSSLLPPTNVSAIYCKSIYIIRAILTLSFPLHCDLPNCAFLPEDLHTMDDHLAESKGT
jgi:hypothetical protein